MNRLLNYLRSKSMARAKAKRQAQSIRDLANDAAIRRMLVGVPFEKRRAAQKGSRA